MVGTTSIKPRGWSLEKIAYEILKSWDFAEDSRISGKISRFPRFHARFLRDSRLQWWFLQDFQILVQILPYWFWISGWCDCLLHTCRLTQCTGRILPSSIHYISCMCDTDNVQAEVIGTYMHAYRLTTDNIQGALSVGIYIYIYKR